MYMWEKINEEFINHTEYVFGNIKKEISEVMWWVCLSWIEMVTKAKPMFQKNMIYLFWNLLRFYNWMKITFFEPTVAFLERKIPDHDMLFEPTLYSWKSITCLYVKTTNESMDSYLDEIVDFFVDMKEDSIDSDFSEPDDEFSEEVLHLEVNKKENHYTETYFGKNEYSFSEDLQNIQKELASFYSQKNPYYFNTKDDVSFLEERLCVFKINGDFVIRTCFVGHMYKNTPVFLSSVFFIYAEYRHPDMKMPIEISLDKRYFLNGNELFTPLFLFRILQYQSFPFLFDKNYTVHLMDINANEVILDYNHFIKINDSHYDIEYLAHSEIVDKNI